MLQIRPFLSEGMSDANKLLKYPNSLYTFLLSIRSEALPLAKHTKIMTSALWSVVYSLEDLYLPEVVQDISSPVGGIFGKDMFFLVIISVRPYASRTDDEVESSAVFRYNTVECKLLF